MSPRLLQPVPYPAGHTFAFSIIDDTDAATLESVRPVYDRLAALGFRTTKTVWPLSPLQPASHSAGDTLDRPAYRRWLLGLQNQGFELVLHNVSGADNPRARILEGLARFRDVFGRLPRINVHHEKNRENLYFSQAAHDSTDRSLFRSRAVRSALALRRLFHPALPPPPAPCEGEDETSPYFWGDLCLRHIDYVRTNVFYGWLDTLHCNPAIPYHRPATPFVNHWFDTSNGGTVADFLRLLTGTAPDALARRHGCALVYTHFGFGFARHGAIHPSVESALAHVARLPGAWLVPVSEILDRLLAFRDLHFSASSGHLAIANAAPEPFANLTLCGPPGLALVSADGPVDETRPGVYVLPPIPAQAGLHVSTAAAPLALRPLRHLRTDLATLALWMNQRISAHRLPC